MTNNELASGKGHTHNILTLIALMATTSGIVYGYNLGVISGAILFIVEDFELSATLKEIAISASLFGAMFGALMGGRLADRIGRRRAIIWGAAIGIIAAVVGAASPVFWLLAAHRVAVGFAFGILACVTPLYLAEISPNATRGRLGALFSVALMVGLLLSYLVDFALHDVAMGWRWMFLIGMIIAVPLIFFTAILPESPRWLLSRGQDDKARNGLRQLLGGQDPSGEIDKLKQTMNMTKARLSDLANPAFRMAIVAGIGLAIIRQGTGVAISTFCAPELMEMAGFSSVTVELMGTVGVGVVYVTMTLVALWLVDRFGRRPLMLTGVAGMVLCFLILFAILRLPEITPVAAVIAVGGLFLFAASFAVGPGAVVFLLISELFPQQIRGIGMGIASFVLWVTYLASTMTFPIIVDTGGKAAAFLIYAVLGAAAWVFVYLFIPETKGRQLEEIKAV